ncbi:hypothetical protein VOLCADRAFT_98025 [Volvox carteri f. nagariensis]|uniref:Uncharacterized protein n=1 Tax=Volvox carteri f. nagariensis TaxID=3068 RepID=D8UE91_VOLCA|nr:uncharacterized protein VOLCADRAFT_98025 [Volvox carteri f. nagariensis]EFJ41964.1 hypothetical protein VOLCADRAFT_98025 [Volvox carteri f. nagariensis]|eukprot:XP_002957001.1 hypothetical protein VOLCADRAFT_98025 [Volvox carteri f. nagariensis]
MVAKSEASMPMSRALAKLAVATDVGTAARPCTAAPAMALSSGPPGFGVGVKVKVGMGPPPPESPSRPLVMKPSAARNVLASLPLPLASTEHQHQGSKVNGAVGPPPPPPPAAAAASRTAAAAATDPQFPPATPAGAHQSSSTHHHHNHHNHHNHQHVGLLSSSSSSPLPPCSAVHGGGPSASADFSREIREAARNHPGLPASLLAQLHRPRRPGAPSSAPFAGTSCTTTAMGPPSAGSASAAAGGSAAGVWPMSPRSRARLTASLVNGTAASGAPATLASPPRPPPPPPPAAAAALSPEALAVLLGSPSQPPPSTPAGLLVMRRAGPAAVGAGAALRPTTSHQGGGGGSTTAAAAPAGLSSPSRPQVMPHITVPYKPGSIRLPMGGVPGLTAAVALGGSPSNGASGAASAAGSGTGSPVVPSTAAAAAAAALGPAASEALRPWTAAANGAGALRPTTANPLTHSMPLDTTNTLVVRMPRTATVAPHAASAAAAPPPQSRCGISSSTAGRTATAESRPFARLSAAPGLTSGGGEQDVRQLTAQELRSVVAALAASRPEVAAVLMSRMATPAAAAPVAGGAAADAQNRPVTGLSRRPTAGPVGDDAATADVAVQGPAWDVEYMYGRAVGNVPPANSRTSSRASTRGSLLSGSAISVGIRDPSVYDDKWPRPSTSSGSRPGSRGGAPTGASGPPPGTADGGGGAAAAARVGNSSDIRRPAISAWGSERRTTLRAIPEEAELDGGGEEGAGDGVAAAAVDVDVAAPLRPLQALDPDPELDSAWASIVAANQRPDTGVMRSPSRGIDVFSRPATGAIRITRQAAPMVLVLEDIAASTPEVLERELENLSLEELQALRAKLCT